VTIVLHVGDIQLICNLQRKCSFCRWGIQHKIKAEIQELWHMFYLFLLLMRKSNIFAFLHTCF